MSIRFEYASFHKVKRRVFESETHLRFILFQNLSAHFSHTIYRYRKYMLQLGHSACYHHQGNITWRFFKNSKENTKIYRESCFLGTICIVIVEYYLAMSISNMRHSIRVWRKESNKQYFWQKLILSFSRNERMAVLCNKLYWTFWC